MEPTGDRAGEPGESAAIRIVEVLDERTAVADQALELIRRAFPARERQPLDQIAMEVEEKRLGLLTSYDFHLLAAVTPEGEAVAVASGVYLAGVNAGFVTYLAVHAAHRGKELGRRLRLELIEAFRRDAILLDWVDLGGVVGEVRLASPWLRRLVRERAVLPLDITYFHPGENPEDPDAEWILYRQPIGDRRMGLPAVEVRQLLYAIWRRAYRVRWPLEREGFRRMLEELEGRDTVGAHPAVPPA